MQQALLGTERSGAASNPIGSTDLVAVLERVDSSDAERALLASAAIVSAYESAGRLPSTEASPSNDVAPADSEDQPVAPAGVAHFLATMLGGVHSQVLREWLRIATTRGWRVPAPLLPALLDVGRANYLQNIIRPVLGARGRWLATQNPDWRWAAAPAVVDESAVRAAWDTGTPEDRVLLLASVRDRDPAFGRRLLESTWETEAASQRALLLATMHRNISAEDEPFLEGVLDDRRQEVRRLAASLLSRLPESAFVSRMTTRARAALRWKPRQLLKEAEVLVEPPTELDAAALRDGIDKKPPAGMGERAWWLSQIVAAVPPQVWVNEWNVDADTIIAAAVRSDWMQALTDGWAAGAMVHRDAAWIEPLLSNASPGEQPNGLAPKLDALLGSLSVDRREAFITKLLRDDAKGDTPLLYLGAADHAWSDPFAILVLDRLRKRVTAGAAPSHAIDWYLRDVIPRLALHVPATLAGATDGWPTGDDAAGFDKALDSFISVLTFRRQLAEELDR